MFSLSRESGYIPLSFIKQIRAIKTLLNSLRNDKQISEVFSPLISDLLLAE